MPRQALFSTWRAFSALLGVSVRTDLRITLKRLSYRRRVLTKGANETQVRVWGEGSPLPHRCNLTRAPLSREFRLLTFRR